MYVLAFGVGRLLFKNRLNFPPLLGYLCAGLLFRNFFCIFLLRELSNPLPSHLSLVIRSLGLSTILMLAGLEIDLKKIRQIGLGLVLRLTSGATPGMFFARILCQTR
jgi:Kef-type K+ transport system membrane component KefB